MNEDSYTNKALAEYAHLNRIEEIKEHADIQNELRIIKEDIDYLKDKLEVVANALGIYFMHSGDARLTLEQIEDLKKNCNFFLKKEMETY